MGLSVHLWADLLVNCRFQDMPQIKRKQIIENSESPCQWSEMTKTYSWLNITCESNCQGTSILLPTTQGGTGSHTPLDDSQLPTPFKRCRCLWMALIPTIQTLRPTLLIVEATGLWYTCTSIFDHDLWSSILDTPLELLLKPSDP